LITGVTFHLMQHLDVARNDNTYQPFRT